MCESVVSIAKAFSLRSIGVGVERSSELDFLKTIGCEAVQGRILGEPLSLDTGVASHDRKRNSSIGSGRI